MADYTSTAYGLGRSRKGGDKVTTNTDLSPILKTADPGKGQKCARYIVAAENEIMAGEIWVNEDTAVAASDTFTITVTADG